MSKDRQIAIVGTVIAAVTLMGTLPTMYASNEPGYARWFKHLNYDMTHIGAHLTLKATLVTCGVCLVVELLAAYWLGYASDGQSDAAVLLIVLVGLLVQFGLAWALWNADGGHAHKALGWGSTGAYVAAIFSWVAGADQREMEARRAKEAARALSKITSPPAVGRGGYGTRTADALESFHSLLDTGGDRSSIPNVNDPLGSLVRNPVPRRPDFDPLRGLDQFIAPPTLDRD